MTDAIDIWYANPSLSRDQACKVLGIPSADAQDMVDLTHSSVQRLPANLRLRIAGYTTGTSDIQWTGADWIRFHNARLIRIDQSNAPGIRGEVKDAEPGASSDGTAVDAAVKVDAAVDRYRRGADACIYCDGSDLGTVQKLLEALGFGIRFVAVQYAWPSYNPRTVIPGTDLTLNEVNADLSVVRPDWMPLPTPRKVRPPLPKPPPHVTIPVTFGGIGTGLVALLHSQGVSLTPAESGAIATFIPSLVGLIRALVKR